MKLFPNLRSLLHAIFCFVFVSAPSAALAHPGHDHADIPSVVRHPLHGWEHATITALLLLIVGLAGVALLARVRQSPARR